MALLPDAIIEIPNEDDVGTISPFRILITPFVMSVKNSLGFNSYLKYHALMSKHLQTCKSCLDVLQVVPTTMSLDHRMMHLRLCKCLVLKKFVSVKIELFILIFPTMVQQSASVV